MKTEDKVLIAFVEPDMPYANYGGKATLLRVNPENWSVDGKPGEVHWDVTMPSGEVCTFPISSIHELNPSEPAGRTGTCQSCKWWAEKPMQTKPPTTEKICNRSRNYSFGAYGQDGKAIITCPDFGCNKWEN